MEMQLTRLLPNGAIAALLLGFTTLATLVFEALRRKPFRKRTPPPPSADGARPIIGHLHHLGGSQPLHVTLAQWADKHGPMFSIKLGVHRAVVISSSELARECFTTHDMILADRPRSTASKILGYNYSMFGISPYGPYWSHVRKITTLELLSNHRISSLKHVRESVVRRLLKELCDTWKGDNGAVVDMKGWFHTVTYNVVFMMVVGKSYSGMDEGSGKDDEKKCKRALSSMMELMGAFVVGDAVPYLKWLDLGGHEKSMRRTARELDELLEGWLREHKEKRMRKKGGGEEDFMDVMLSILDNADESLGHDADTTNKATTQALILGGTDPTMVTLTWALSLLLNHPDALKKAQEELDLNVGRERLVSDSDVKNLPYLQAIVKETLRLYPAAPLGVFHISTEDCTIGGYRVVSGTQLITNLWKLHRDPTVWSDPEEFKPERFLTTYKNMDVRGQNFEFLPFGSGRRICPGISFALQVSLFVLASVIQGFNLRTPKDEAVDMSVGLGLTSPKATPLQVVLTPRLAADHLYG